MTRLTVGVVGLGAMGSRMAGRLLDHGHEVVVHNRTRDRELALVDRGAGSAESPAELAGKTDLVVGCLLHDASIEQVYGGPDGLLAGSRPGQVFVEHATFSPALAQRLAADLASRGARFVDAPVSGGPEGASAGSLTVMAGGDPDAVDVARPVLEAYAARVVHVGPAGAGSALKLVNQLLVSCHVAAAAEAEQLLQRLGVSDEHAQAVLTTSWGDSAMLRRMFSRRSQGGSERSEATIGGLREPQRLLTELASAHRLPLPVTSAAMDVFHSACNDGRDADDLVDLVAVRGGVR